jgi:hypothetical protein
VTLEFRNWQKILGVVGVVTSTSSAFGSIVLLVLLYSGRLASANYESFLTRQETLLRVISLLILLSFMAVLFALFDRSKRRIVAVAISILTAIPMSFLFFITMMARF